MRRSTLCRKESEAQNEAKCIRIQAFPEIQTWYSHYSSDRDTMPNIMHSLNSFHVINSYLLTILNGLAVFKAKSTSSSRGKRCNNVRPLASSVGVKQIYFVSDMKVRFL